MQISDMNESELIAFCEEMEDIRILKKWYSKKVQENIKELTKYSWHLIEQEKEELLAMM